MQIASRMAGYSLGEADILRRAMGKKKKEVMAAERREVPRARAGPGDPLKEGRREGVRPDGVLRRVRLQQIALGRVRPRRVSDRVAEGAPSRALHGRAADEREGEHRQAGEVRQRVPRDGDPRAPARRHPPPGSTSPSKGSGIRFGLSAIKNVGEAAIRSILEVRQRRARFASLPDLCSEVDLRLVNKRVLEALVQSGALDSFGRAAEPASRQRRRFDRVRATETLGTRGGPDQPLRRRGRRARS